MKRAGGLCSRSKQRVFLPTCGKRPMARSGNRTFMASMPSSSVRSTDTWQHAPALARMGLADAAAAIPCDGCNPAHTQPTRLADRHRNVMATKSEGRRRQTTVALPVLPRSSRHGGDICQFAIRQPELETLLEEGAQFTWAAGPLAKGSNLCHGTGGNGYAFLKLYQRTQRTVWLKRARAFAMTAIAQCREARHEYGRSRYSLWTGDVGLAIYLWDCLTGRPRFPTVDVF